MENPLASGPVELFSRIDDYQVDNAAAAANEGIVMTTLDAAVNWARKNSSARHPSPLPADARAQMGDLDGRLRHLHRRLQ
jgi:hypothetical protein